MKKCIVILLSLISLNISATNYYVSTSGNNSNNGTSISTPWQTLSKVSGHSFSAGDSILFKRGDVFYGDSITTNWDGTSGSHITLAAYGTGANPKFSGLSSVIAWTSLGGNIWQSTSAVSTITQCNILLINGVNTPMGMIPKSDPQIGGFYYFQSYTTTSLTSSGLTGTPNWTGAECVIRNGSWSVNRVKVSSQSGGTLNFSSSGIYQSGKGFFFQNDIRCLTQQNDWMYDQSTKKLNFYSTATPSNVMISTVVHLVNIRNSYIDIKHIDFEGANDVAIYDPYANTGSNIWYCNFSNMGIAAIYLRNDSVDIENCNFTEINTTAIGMRFGNNETVMNNYFHNIGIYQGMRTHSYYVTAYGAIQMEEGSNYLIKYNKLVDIGYIGISVYASTFTVQNNFVDTFCRVLDDGSGIYTYTGGARAMITSALITGNICINGLGTPYGTGTQSGAAGLYCDEQSKNIELSYNSSANTYMYGVQYNLTNGNLNFHNNTIYNSNQLGIFTSYAPSAGFIPYGNKIKRNIIVSKVASGTSPYYSVPLGFQFNNSDSLTGQQIFLLAYTLDSNYYAKPTLINTNVVKSGGSYYTLSGWKTASSQDAHSHDSPQAVISTDSISFVYNPTVHDSTVSLARPMIDMAGTKYSNSITLSPYSSAVLLVDHNSAYIPSTETNIVSFTLPGQSGSSVINSSSHTIGITMPYGTLVTSLAASFSLSAGATAKVGSTSQTSGITSNNFTSPVTYIVKAENGINTQNWIITVNLDSPLPQNSSTKYLKFNGKKIIYQGAIKI